MGDVRRWGRNSRQLTPGVALGVAIAALVLLAPLDRAPQQQYSATNALGGSTGDALGTGTSGATAPGSTAPGGAVVQGGPGGTSLGHGGGASVGTTGDLYAGTPGDTPKSYQGVTSTTVKWGFSAQDKGCGGFDQGAVAAAYGGSSTPGVDYQALQEYFNKYPLTDFPLPPDIRANVNAKTGYWGRKIISVFRDSGGFACPDVGRANAVTMAEQDKVFGLVMRGNEGPEVPMSLVMSQHKLIFIGRQNTGPIWESQRAPYFWDGMWGEGVSENLALGSWVCRDWAGKKAYDTGDPLVTGMPRKFGTAFPDDPGFKQLADILGKELAKCGATSKQYAYPFDLQTLEAQAQATVNRMRADGVTTVLMVNDFISRLMMTTAATNQNWHPEWVSSGWGMGGYANTYRTFSSPDQAANSWAAADNASLRTPEFHHSEAYLAWKKVRPTSEPDGDWPSYYYQFKLLALGMAGAGRDLTPTTFGQGLARVCNPCPRANPLLPLQRLFPGHWTNWDGFTLVRFNPNKPDPTSPPSQTGSPPMGYFDFLEGGKRYGLRITDPAPR